MTDIDVVRSTEQLTALLDRWKQEHLTIGFVPTMGALHDGHLSLVTLALEHADRVVVSIFVNPRQFGQGEDLESYPRTFEDDLVKLEEAGAHLVFFPSSDDIYPAGFSTSVSVSGLTDTLCGRYRPEHFEGVATVCAVLFGIVKPDIAVFGRKDAQQLAVIRRMVDDLRFGIRIIAGEIVREPDGLAMSSRNAYLTKEERAQASFIYKGLSAASELVSRGETDAESICAAARNIIASASLGRIQYLELVDALSMKPLGKLSTPALLAIAVYFGRTRLIDNLILKPEGF
jgi:pantoate--beta-alanine ligase